MPVELNLVVSGQKSTKKANKNQEIKMNADGSRRDLALQGDSRSVGCPNRFLKLVPLSRLCDKVKPHVGGKQN